MVDLEVVLAGFFVGFAVVAVVAVVCSVVVGGDCLLLSTILGFLLVVIVLIVVVGAWLEYKISAFGNGLDLSFPHKIVFRMGSDKSKKRE